MKLVYVAAAALLGLAVMLPVAIANDFPLSFKVIDCAGNSVPNVTVALSGCVDPSTGILASTDYNGMAIFDNDIQYCRAPANKLCTWSLMLDGNTVPFSGPTTLADASGTSVTPRMYACNCLDISSCGCCNTAHLYPVITLTVTSLAHPKVTVKPPGHKSICSDVRKKVLVFKVSSSQAGSINLTPSSDCPDKVNCTSFEDVDVDASTEKSVEVTCRLKKGASWPSSFKATLKATQGSGDCSSTASGATKVSIKECPVCPATCSADIPVWCKETEDYEKHLFLLTTNFVLPKFGWSNMLQLSDKVQKHTVSGVCSGPTSAPKTSSNGIDIAKFDHRTDCDDKGNKIVCPIGMKPTRTPCPKGRNDSNCGFCCIPHKSLCKPKDGHEYHCMSKLPSKPFGFIGLQKSSGCDDTACKAYGTVRGNVMECRRADN